MADPVVSVIVPCRDETELANVFRWPDWAEMLFQFEEGIGSARNAGVARATTPILVFMDADVKLSGDLETVMLIPGDIDAAFTAEKHEYNGPNKWTTFAVYGYNLLVSTYRLSSVYGLPSLPMITQASLMACHRNFFRPFTDDKQEDVRWGEQFPQVRLLPITSEFLRPQTNPLEWRRRRGEGISS